MDLYDNAMSIDELCQVNELVDSPIVPQQTASSPPRVGRKRSKEDWDTGKVLEIKRVKKRKIDYSPDSSPVYCRVIETVATVHQAPLEWLEHSGANGKVVEISDGSGLASNEENTPPRKRIRPCCIDFDAIEVIESIPVTPTPMFFTINLPPAIMSPPLSPVEISKQLNQSTPFQSSPDVDDAAIKYVPITFSSPDLLKERFGSDISFDSPLLDTEESACLDVGEEQNKSGDEAPADSTRSGLVSPDFGAFELEERLKDLENEE